MPDIAIIPSAGTDRWGDERPPAMGHPGTYGDAYPPPAPIVLRKIKVWPRQSDESDTEVLYTGISMLVPRRKRVPTAADSVLVGIEVAPDGTPVAGTGKAYEVVGEQGELYSSGNGPLKGTIVNLDRRT